MQKPLWELASIGSISPGRVDVVSILKLWRRVPVRTCVAVGDRSGSGSDWPQAAAARVKYLDMV